MKKILILILGIIMCSGAADAQNLLDQLGKSVKKKVTEKITDAVRQEVRKSVSGKGQSNSRRP